MEKLGIGIVGCGNICGIYFTNLTTVFRNIEVRGCVDLIDERQKHNSEKFGVPVMSFDEMLKDEKIKLILNITQPCNHYDVSRRTLEGGKSSYCEKPLSLTFAQGSELAALAAEKGLYMGGAPDTFLGAGIQSCREYIDGGLIGEPIGATAFMLCHGHESWHPDPEFYYEFGGGPMFDMGPYYLTALINLMGGVKTVSGMTEKSFPTRRITSEPKFGKIVDVEVPTHVSGLMRFENGAVATIITSFDVWGSKLPNIEIYGTRGTMVVPDPNGFGGPVYVKLNTDSEFRELPLTHIYAENSRGLGLSDMAQAILDGRPARAGVQQTRHVLELMEAFHRSSDTGRHYRMTTKYKRQPPLPRDLIKGCVK